MPREPNRIMGTADKSHLGKGRSLEKEELAIQREGVPKSRRSFVCFLTQKELLQLFEKFKKAFWGITLSDHDWLPARQWGEDRALYRTICFCLYQLIEHRGMSFDYDAIFQNGFDKAKGMGFEPSAQ